MEPSLRVQGACLVVELPAELDHPATDLIRRESDSIMGRTYIREIVFDFARTSFMDSSGVGLIMGRYRALGMRAGCVRAVNVSSHIHKLLHLSGIHKYIEIQKTAEMIGE